MGRRSHHAIIAETIRSPSVLIDAAPYHATSSFDCPVGQRVRSPLKIFPTGATSEDNSVVPLQHSHPSSLLVREPSKPIRRPYHNFAASHLSVLIEAAPYIASAFFEAGRRFGFAAQRGGFQQYIPSTISIMMMPYHARCTQPKAGAPQRGFSPPLTYLSVTDRVLPA